MSFEITTEFITATTALVSALTTLAALYFLHRRRR